MYDMVDVCVCVCESIRRRSVRMIFIRLPTGKSEALIWKFDEHSTDVHHRWSEKAEERYKSKQYS